MVICSLVFIIAELLQKLLAIVVNVVRLAMLLLVTLYLVRLFYYNSAGLRVINILLLYTSVCFPVCLLALHEIGHKTGFFLCLRYSKRHENVCLQVLPSYSLCFTYNDLARDFGAAPIGA